MAGVPLNGYQGAFCWFKHGRLHPIRAEELAGWLNSTCPVVGEAEVARIARYLAKESSGQCGPCQLGLPGIARSLSALAEGSGGMDALDTARRAAGSVRGRGACSHPDGASDDLSA